MPRGICLRRREAASPDIQQFLESPEKGSGKTAS